MTLFRCNRGEVDFATLTDEIPGFCRRPTVIKFIWCAGRLPLNWFRSGAGGLSGSEKIKDSDVHIY